MKKNYKSVPTLIKQEIESCDYQRKDDLVIVVDTIYRSLIYFKNDLQKYWGYNPISQAMFMRYFGCKTKLKDAIQYSIDMGWIKRYGDSSKCNGYYVIGQQSKAYKIASEYLGSTDKWLINDTTINKKINAIVNGYKRTKLKNLTYSKSNYFKTFTMNEEGAKNAIENKALEEIQELDTNLSKQAILDLIQCKNDYKMSRIVLNGDDNKKLVNNIIHRVVLQQLQVQSITNGYLFYKRNKTNGRLDSNLTSLPNYLKPFIINQRGEDLIHIDLKNSQPFFFYTLLKNDPSINKDELELYRSLVTSGNLYEYMIEEYSKTSTPQSFLLKTPVEKRDYIKKIIFKIFYSKNESYEKYKTFFGSMFPTILEHINLKNKIKHNTMAIQLQTMESFTIIDKILIPLQNEGVLPFTIHDSFLVGDSESERLLNLLNEVFNTLYGCVPSLHIDTIGKPEIIEDDTEDELEMLSFTEFLTLSEEDAFSLNEQRKFLKELETYEVYIPDDNPEENTPVTPLPFKVLSGYEHLYKS